MAGIINTTQQPAIPNYTAQAQTLYQNNLGRNGDPNGVSNWAGQLAAGKSMDEVNSSFKDAAKGVYNDYLTNPNSTNAADPKINGLLSSDLNQGAVPGAATGAAQEVAKKNLNPTIYNNLYGGNSPSSGQPNPITGQTASTYNPVQLGESNKWNVTPEQTVEGRINSILNPNSPIIQQARTQALQGMNARGLINSSIATGAADNAAYSAAIPIATADAQTAAKAAGYNADEQNQFAVHNADLSNTALQFGAAAQNTLAGQKLDAQTKTNLATFDAQNKQLLQTNTSAANLFNQTVTNLTNIANSTTMDAAAKQAASDNQMTLLHQGMVALGATAGTNPGDISSLNLGQYFTQAPASAAAPPNGIINSQAGTYTSPNGQVWASKEAYDQANPGGS